MPKPVFLYVVDFDSLQHYKHRSPPWIKLHSKTWDDPAFECLTDASKAHFLGICVLASKHNNRIPLNVKWIEKHISAVTPLDLKELYASGLIAQSGKSCLQGATSEKSRDRVEESRGETESTSEYTPEFDRFWSHYPKKVGKGDAFASWMKNGHPAIDRVVEILEMAKRTRRWIEEKQFIPNPATWLNQKRWDDEYITVEQEAEKAAAHVASVYGGKLR